MAIDAASADRRPGADPSPPPPRRRRGPRWWVILLAAVVAVAAGAVLVVQLLPDPADGPAVAGVTTVELRGNRFHPAVIQVKPGQTVTWSFVDNGTTHNVKGTGWGSPNQASGTFRHAFAAAGSYRYSCTLHVGMTGRVDVAASP
jgi:plastocyanin